MRVILIAVECLNYADLKNYHTPNIDSMEVGPCPAYSHGTTTRTAVAGLLGGILPNCMVKDCPHTKATWTSPFFLTDLQKKTNLFIACPNGWILELLRPFMPDWLWKKNLDWHGRHQEQPSKMALDEFERANYDNYFFYLHVMEDHPPFYCPDFANVKDKLHPQERRKRAVEWTDREIIGRVLKYNYEQLVVVGDHALEHNVPRLRTEIDPDSAEASLAREVRGIQDVSELPIGHSLRTFIASNGLKRLQ